MKLKIERRPSSAHCTLGELYVNGIYECWTLEDVVRPLGQKVPGKTAIPAGIYQVLIDYSHRFQKLMPHIAVQFSKSGVFPDSVVPEKDVPGFAGVRIHAGNSSEDTEGCVLLGKYRGQNDDWISNSREAFQSFYDKLKSALDRGDICMLEITDAKP